MIRPGFDHVAKFQGDQPRDFGERMAKHHRQNVRPPVLPYGGPNKPVKLRVENISG